MDDTALKVVLGLAAAGWLIITKWTYGHATHAHTKVDEDRRTTGQRFSKIESVISQCKQEVDKEMSTRMTEAQIKDFVDRTVGHVVGLVKDGTETTKNLDDKFDAMNLEMARVATMVQSLVDEKKQ